LLEFGEDLAGDLFESFEDAVAAKGDGFENGFVPAAQFFGQILDREDIRQIPLIELQNVGNLLKVVSVLLKVIHEVVEGLVVGVHALLLRVGDEDDAIDAAQDQLAAGVVEDLSGNGIKMDTGFEAANGAEIERQKVEEKGTIGLRGQRDHFALLLLGGLLVNVLEIGGLAAQARAVVDDFAIDFPGCKIDETQRLPSKLAADVGC